MRPPRLEPEGRVPTYRTKIADRSVERRLGVVEGETAAAHYGPITHLIAPEYEAVAVATKEGRVITGLRINETNFSIQLTEENGRFHSLLKRDLEEVKVMKKSLMPDNFAELLTVKDLHDLFAYLMTLE